MSDNDDDSANQQSDNANDTLGSFDDFSVDADTTREETVDEATDCGIEETPEPPTAQEQADMADTETGADAKSETEADLEQSVAEETGVNLEQVEAEVETVADGSGSAGYTRSRINVQLGDGPDQRGDTTVEEVRESRAEALTGVRSGIKENVEVLTDALGLNDDAEADE